MGQSRPARKRYYVSFPDDDPRFVGLRAYLDGVQGRGRTSPTARMIEEFALLGFLLTTGQLALGAPVGPPPGVQALPADVPSPAEAAQLQAAIADAMTAFPFD